MSFKTVLFKLSLWQLYRKKKINFEIHIFIKIIIFCIYTNFIRSRLDEPTTPGGHDDGILISQRFSPTYQSDSNKDGFLSGDDLAIERHTLSRRSQSPFFYQGQNFQTAPSPLANSISGVSINSHSNSSQHRRHHHRHGHSRHESPSHYPQRPRTPSPTPHSQRVSHDHTFSSRPNSRPSDFVGNTDASVLEQQHPSDMAPVVSDEKRQSYIVSIFY